MDRRGRALVGALFAFSASLSAFAADVPLRAARWVKAPDPAAVLTEHPAECLARTDDAEQAWSVEVGRAVFRSPTLLGGPAARVGLTCESCHRNGRGNPTFSFPGVSGAAGTADVTSALFSSFREDGIDNPKVIPDLASPARKTLNANMNDLLHGLVVEEFNGAKPPPGVQKGLHDYVQALGPAYCGADRPEKVTLAGDMQAVRRAVLAAIGAIDRNDPETAIVVVQAARQMLGQVDERFGLLDGAGRLALHQAGRDLGEVERVVGGDAADAKVRLTEWLARLDSVTAALAPLEDRSLYNTAILRGELAR